MNKPFYRLIILILLPLTLFSKNSSEDAVKKAEKELPKECIFYFKMYLNAHTPKAFAYAVDSTKKATCRFSAGAKDQKKAEEVALFSCQKSAIQKGIIADCKIYRITQDIEKSKKKLSFEEKYLINLATMKKKLSPPKKKSSPTKSSPKKTAPKKEPTAAKKAKAPSKKIEKKRTKREQNLPKSCEMFYALFQEAESFKAFAIAVDDHDKKYACKFSAKSTSLKKAKEVALASCEKSRIERGIKAPCQIFSQDQNCTKKVSTQKRTTPKSTKTPKPKKVEKKIPSNPALEQAILEANLSKIKKLIKKGGDVNTQASDHSRALFVAVAQGDIAYAKKLFDKGAYPFFRKKDGNNLLVAAIMSGKSAMLKLILEKGLDPNIACEEGNTPLHFALMMFDDEMMKLLYAFGASDEIDNHKGDSVKDLAKEYHVNLKRIRH